MGKIIIAKISEKINIVFKKEKNLDILFSIAIFIISFIKMVAYIDTNTATHPNRITPYILTYSDIGFANRLFLGNIISFFTKYVKSSTIVTFVINFRIIFLASLSYLYYTILRQIDEEKLKKILYFLISIFHFFPFYTLNTSSGQGFLMTDVFLEFFCIISIVILYRFKYSFWFLSIIPIICGIATHSIFIFMFFPAFFICYIYNWVNLNINIKKKLILMILNLVPIVVCFLIFMFHQNLKVDTPEEIINIISNKSFYGEYINSHYNQVFNYLNYEYFKSFFDNVKYYNPYQTKYISRWCQLLFIFIIIMITFGRVWLLCFKKAIKIQEKLLFLIAFLSIFSVLPMALVGIDFIRWSDAIIASQFIVIFTMIYKKDYILIQIIYDIYYKNEKLSYINCLLLLIICLLCSWQRQAGEVTFIKNFFNNLKLLI